MFFLSLPPYGKGDSVENSLVNVIWGSPPVRDTQRQIGKTGAEWRLSSSASMGYYTQQIFDLDQ